MNRRRRLTVCLALIAGMTSACGTATDRDSSRNGTDRPLDGIELQSLGTSSLGASTTLRPGTPTELPMVMNLWATWCAPCRAELPAFNAAAAAHTGSARFVGVNIGEESDEAAAFIEEIGAGFDHYADPTASVQAALSVTNLPATVFFSSDGAIARIHRGAVDAEELEALLASELGVVAPPASG